MRRGRQLNQTAAHLAASKRARSAVPNADKRETGALKTF